MNNSKSITNSYPEKTDVADILIQIVWFSGIVVSILCFVLQLAFFALIPNCRKTDEKILIQITATRILVTFCEYFLVYLNNVTRIHLDVIFLLYFVSDFALICWMLVFTKNLYDNIVVVFANRKQNLFFTSIIVWTVSLPFSIIGIYILKKHINYFSFFYKLIYATAKFLIAIVNLLIYFRIFYIAFRRSSESSRKLRDIVKSALVAFLLISTTTLQILIADLLTYLIGISSNMALVKAFGIINSFHAVCITAIFVIIMKSRLKDSLRNTVKVRLACSKF